MHHTTQLINLRTLCLAGALALLLANRASAQNFSPPASGLLVQDLAGSPTPSGWTDYTASFVASSTDTTVTWVFRDDPGFIDFADPDVADANDPTVNLLANPGFTGGVYNTPGAPIPDWTYFTQATAFPQYLGYSDGSGDFVDGSTQSYDGIYQTFATTVGDTYDVSYMIDLTGVVNTPVFTDQSNNGDTTDTGGDGIDVVTYGGTGLPPSSVPDAASTLALLLGTVGILVLSRRLVAQA
jgi:hypothetical protein